MSEQRPTPVDPVSPEPTPEPHHVPTDQPPAVGRRTVLRAAGIGGAGVATAAALAACGSSSTPTTQAPAPSTSSGSSSSSSSSSSGSSTSSGSGTSSSGGAAPSGTPVKTADVPVGSGKIQGSDFVVTQPAAGEFKAFSPICTHQGCPVTRIENGMIVCPCHNSMFDITTGAPTASSQAKQPLSPKTATVSGDSVYIS